MSNYMTPDDMDSRTLAAVEQYLTDIGALPAVGDGASMTLEEIAEFAEDYENDMLDREDWNRGQW